MERPETEPVSRVTHLIRVIEKHIKKMSEALDNLEKAELPHKYFTDADAGKERSGVSGGEENPASKP